MSQYRSERQDIKGARTLCHALQTAAAMNVRSTSRTESARPLLEEVPAPLAVNAGIADMLNDIKSQNQKILDQLDQGGTEKRAKLVPKKTEVR